MSRAGSRSVRVVRARTASESGFTLIELLAALAIMALAASVVSINTSRGQDRTAASHLAIEIAARARWTRTEAIRSGQDKVLLIDLGAREIVSGGKPLHVSDAIAVDVTVGAGERLSPTVAGIRFFANGMSTGGTIGVRYSGRAYEVRVNWFTGRVSIQQLG